MSKRIIALCLALLCLAALVGCKKEPEKEKGPWGYQGTPPENNIEDGENTPQGLGIRFDAGTVGFDTTTSTVRTASGSYTVDFSAKLDAMYYDMTEANFENLPEDLSYQTLKQAAPPADAKTVTLTLITSEGTRTVTSDTAALALEGNADISNFAYITTLFTKLADSLAATGTPRS